MDGMESTRLKQKESRELAKARMIVFQEEERAKDEAIAINRARKALSHEARHRKWLERKMDEERQTN